MAKPWERYQQQGTQQTEAAQTPWQRRQSAGPWSRYQQPSEAAAPAVAAPMRQPSMLDAIAAPIRQPSIGEQLAGVTALPDVRGNVPGVNIAGAITGARQEAASAREFALRQQMPAGGFTLPSGELGVGTYAAGTVRGLAEGAGVSAIGDIPATALKFAAWVERMNRVRTNLNPQNSQVAQLRTQISNEYGQQANRVLNDATTRWQRGVEEAVYQQGQVPFTQEAMRDVGRTVPMSLAASLTPGGIGVIAMFGSTAEDAYQQAVARGMNEADALKYSTLIGASEYATEQLDRLTLIGRLLPPGTAGRALRAASPAKYLGLVALENTLSEDINTAAQYGVNALYEMPQDSTLRQQLENTTLISMLSGPLIGAGGLAAQARQRRIGNDAATMLSTPRAEGLSAEDASALDMERIAAVGVAAEMMREKNVPQPLVNRWQRSALLDVMEGRAVDLNQKLTDIPADINAQAVGAQQTQPTQAAATPAGAPEAAAQPAAPLTRQAPVPPPYTPEQAAADEQRAMEAEAARVQQAAAPAALDADAQQLIDALATREEVEAVRAQSQDAAWNTALDARLAAIEQAVTPQAVAPVETPVQSAAEIARTTTTAPQEITTPTAETQQETRQPWQMTREEYAAQGGDISHSAIGGHRDIIDAAFERGENIPDEVLRGYPWLAARKKIRPYVERLKTLSDKQLKEEEKRVSNDLNRWARETRTFTPDGEYLNPKLFTQEKNEVSEKFDAVMREIDLRKNGPPTTRKASPRASQRGQALVGLGIPQLVDAVVNSATAQQTRQALTTLGRRVYDAGATTWRAWHDRMRSLLGRVWGKVQGMMRQTWNDVRAFTADERGMAGVGRTTALTPEQQARVDALVAKMQARKKPTRTPEQRDAARLAAVERQTADLAQQIEQGQLTQPPERAPETAALREARELRDTLKPQVDALKQQAERARRMAPVTQPQQQEVPEAMRQQLAQEYEAARKGETPKQEEARQNEYKRFKIGVVGRALIPVSSLMRRISPRLWSRLNRFERDSMQGVSRTQQKLVPFLQRMRSMPKTERAVLDLALKNGDRVTAQEIIDRNGMTDAFSQYRNTLNELYERAVDAGFDVGYLEDFSPRLIRDVDGLLNALQTTEEHAVITQEINRELEKNPQMTDDEKAEIVNRVLRGFQRSGVMLGKPGQLKERSVPLITAALNKYYNDTETAALKYAEKVVEAIEARKFFGRSAKFAQGATLNLGESIGALALDMIERGEMNAAAQQLLADALQARFGYRATPRGVSTWKQANYLVSISNIASTLTQIQDLAYSVYNAGPIRTTRAMLSAARGKQEVSVADLGIERPWEEFGERGGLSRTLEKALKIVGFSWMDQVGKESLVNATLAKLREQARSRNFDEKAERLISETFGEDRAAVEADLREGRMSEDVNLLLFNTLANFQPVTKSEMPITYLNSPSGRVFYQLKTYTIKQIDNFRRESFDLMAQGKTKEGLNNLAWMGLLLLLGGMGTDELKDWLLGRETVIDRRGRVNADALNDRVIDNILRLAGLNRYLVQQVRTTSPVEMLLKLVAPPAPLAERPVRDLMSLWPSANKGLPERWKEFRVRNVESVQNIPVLGKPYYWWWGGGAEKTREREKKRRRQQQ